MFIERIRTLVDGSWIDGGDAAVSPIHESNQ
jgi:hypothetical protein